ncbi:peptidoglycan-recognition protein LC-like isoform X2 [Sitodiplosis mosellana]|uniref:peptidoglycan-recognition protein LC-like isoform X2 n=1 Tax=Sitodiplosis mosellana TaxID=263140 RepID=UPI002443C854|nr:peptidoglycan-recognition protein LC-like isoform X2 [Sitodiplosis mosellana]
MSNLVLSAVNLHTKAHGNVNNGHIGDTETPIQIDDLSCINTEDTTIATTSKPIGFLKNENKSDFFVTNRQRSPTKYSLGSNNISIVTFDENENDSSVIDSDSDGDDVINFNEYRNSVGSVVVNKFVEPPNICQSNNLCAINNAKPNIGSLAVQNSSDVTFGDKYLGPVTINQYVHDNELIGYANNSTVNKFHSDQIHKKWKWTKKHVIVGVIAGGILTSALFAVILVVKLNSDEDSLPSPVKIISRKQWGAKPAKVELKKLNVPTHRVIIHHTGIDYCTTQDECIALVQYTQIFHMFHKGWDDIAYNFLVGGDGAVYVGRGYNLEGSHTLGHNNDSICIAFIGRFNDIEPPKRQLYAAQKIIEEGLELETLAPNYNLYGHCQLGTHASPGPALFRIIKNWNHWTDNPMGICQS